MEILEYDPKLKTAARKLRANMTDAESRLWYRLRRKQVCNVQFYRQKPIGPYVVDFYAPKAGLVVEVDGSQHLEPDGVAADAARNRFLADKGIRVLHFDNLQVLRELQSVVTAIYQAIAGRVGYE
ncbi:MAG TPA: endonuclease domain-containing protein [Gammaproteobacteria bacterium]|nr:endonuclease domain-containing protein [Gammaproteobacteria bacterium]